MNIINIKNLSKTYDYYKKEPGFFGSLKTLVKREKLFAEAVKDISFTIQPGEMVGFLGPNGAGKTTTLKMLSGILYPTSGSATVLGSTPWLREATYQKQFALVMGQKNQLWWDLPAMETFLLNKEIYELDKKKFDNSLEELTELLNIKDILNVQVRKLSLGQRMKCELVAALLHQPKVLLLDEPTIGLDVVSQNNIREFLKKYNREKNTTILLTSHYMEDIEALCQRVIIINFGVIIYDGQLSDLMNKYVHQKIIDLTFTSKVDKKQLTQYGEVKDFDGWHAVLAIEKSETKKAAGEILNQLPVDDILINEIPVEDVIRNIFSERQN
ncbi:MAG: ABC transporter [Candidatus Magasanikbacteria bacterium GW2011_GWA2_37_8]|uniref:ABC transporter n=1 Tax=Candidatus Magasanikbacteria bacterium GW2011_GWA2_37_8 TaxID=1619036 RepID=A0A0G0HG56_9BACT|nr:MAG: ABC transporter [Candidatus Magasanikbacteria bacterium GW2011_GWA2_37_8]